jgi:hypothetical protein
MISHISTLTQKIEKEEAIPDSPLAIIIFSHPPSALLLHSFLYDLKISYCSCFYGAAAAGAPFSLSTPLLTKSLTFLTAVEWGEDGGKSVGWTREKERRKMRIKCQCKLN